MHNKICTSWIRCWIAQILTRHGPKPWCQEAEAEAFSILEAEAEALTLFKLEAEALVMKPKPMLLHVFAIKKIGRKVEASVNHEAEAFEDHKAEARLSKI